MAIKDQSMCELQLGLKKVGVTGCDGFDVGNVMIVGKMVSKTR